MSMKSLKNKIKEQVLAIISHNNMPADVQERITQLVIIAYEKGMKSGANKQKKKIKDMIDANKAIKQLLK